MKAEADKNQEVRARRFQENAFALVRKHALTGTARISANTSMGKRKDEEEVCTIFAKKGSKKKNAAAYIR